MTHYTFSVKKPGRLLLKSIRGAFLSIVFLMTLLVLDGYAVQNQDVLSQNHLRNRTVSAQFIKVHQSEGEDYIVSMNVKDMKLTTALRELTKQINVGLSYDSDADLDHTISYKAQDAAFYDVLDRMLNGTGLEYLVSPNRNVLVIRPLKDSNDESFQHTVSGQVVDAQTGEPLPGVNILIEGTSSGISTDVEGTFELSVESLQDTLIVSYIGYEQLEVPIDGQNELMIELVSGIISGDELVVVGYGTQRKSDLTGSVGAVSSEQIQNRPTTNIEQALAGRIAGVDVSINSGEPGGSPQIRIRGITSVSNTNDPLYVIDGVMLNVERMQNNSHVINFLDPSSIESIEVLKDASATAIYGARGANGVVLITTKQGSTEGGRISYNSYVSVGNVARRMDLMNSEEWLWVEEMAYQNVAKFDPEGYAQGAYNSYNPEVRRRNFMVGNTQGNIELFDENLDPLYNTDWQDEAFQNAITHNHSLSFAAGNEQTRYGLYLTYRDEDGVIKNSWLNRYSGRFVINSNINDWLDVGGNINYSVQSQRYHSYWAHRAVYQNVPIIPVRDPDDGTYVSGETYPGTEGPNQRLIASGDRNILDTQTTVANVFTNIHLSDDLTLKTMVAMNAINQETNRYAGRNLPRVSLNQGGIATISTTNHENWQFENLLSYQTEINNRQSLNALLGQSIQISESFSHDAQTYGFLDDYYQYNNLGIGDDPRPSSSSASRYSMSSIFSRVNYTLDNKYLATVTGRIDGSSKFGENNRYAFFPSVALGWLMSGEDFLKNNHTISNLKLRTSYGLTGNSEISNYQYEAGLGQYTSIFGGSRTIGIGVNRLSNPELRWETNAQFDAGLELGLFENRISLEMDIYHRVSRDMLLNRPVPRSSGYATVTENIGSMENRGLEVSLKTYNIQTSNFFWSTDFNITFNRNEVLELHGGSDIVVGGSPGGSPGTVIMEGEPINSFLGYNRLGTWNTDEADEAAIYNRLPGDIKYEDLNNDGVISTEDMQIIGNGLPDSYGSFINTFSYRNFEAIVDLQFMYGNDVMFELTGVLEDRTGAYNNHLRTVLDAWKPDNQDTSIAQNKPLAVGYDINSDTHRMKNGSVIRGRNFTLAYSLPQEWLSSFNIRNLRISASAQNLFVISNYPGYDPEVSTFAYDHARGRGGYEDYPKPRTFMLGINLEL